MKFISCCSPGRFARMSLGWALALTWVGWLPAEVRAQNTAPTISNIADLTAAGGGPVGPITFTVNDAETSAGSLTLSGFSSNQGLIPNDSLVFGGSGSTRTLTLMPVSGQTGSSLILVQVSDGGLVTSDTFLATITSGSGGGGGGGNTPPTISNIADRTAQVGATVGPVPFTVGDAETPVENLTLSGQSTNPSLVPSGSILFAGSGANRSFIITPTAGLSGTATITITVNDGTLTASDSFLLTVGTGGGGGGGNTPPTISDIADRSSAVGATVGPITFTVGDAETPAANLTLSGQSSNPAVVPNASILFGGSGGSRSVIITPTAGVNGTTTITITVSDGTLTASDSFVLTVGTGGGGGGGNTPPTISDIADRSSPVSAPVGPVTFTVGDAETPAANLTLSGQSSNQSLVPGSSILFGGAGSNRSVIITPTEGVNGTTTITITVSDGTATASDSFVLTVGTGGGGGSNTPPTISDIPNQTTPLGTPLGPVTFTIGDAETPAANLTVSARSSNQSLVSDSGILFGGTGNTRSMIITPNSVPSGTTTITVTVSDGSLVASDSFVLTVGGSGGNAAPTITDIPNQTTGISQPIGPITFTVGDDQTDVFSLVVSGQSSNQALLPNSSILFGGSGANRAVILTPTEGVSGTTTITLTVSDGALTASDSFNLVVGGGANTPPTLSNTTDKSTGVGQSIGPITVTVGDAQTPAADLALTGQSSNQSLVPNTSILIGGTGATRAVIITPTAGLSGTTTITLTVSDGSLTASDTFVLTVGAGGNTPPTISNVADQSTAAGQAVGPVSFTVGDAETPAAGLGVSGTSSNPAIVANANILFGGSGADRAVIITPNPGATGTVTITLTVSDGSLTASDTFVLSVGSGSANTPPTISAIANQSTAVGQSIGPLPFTVGDATTPANDLVVTATSSLQTLVPDGNILLGGSGADRILVITPASGRTGVAEITVTVSDGSLSANSKFQLTVGSGGGPGNTPPTISDIPNQTLLVGQASAPIAFTISDAETAPESLTLTTGSSDLSLIPAAAIVLGGSGGNRTVTVTPAPGRTGSAVISILVSDGILSASDTFTVTVAASGQNTAPVISDITDKTTSVGQAVGPISFSVTDAETPAGDLVVTATSSNTDLVPNTNLQLGGAGANRSITVSPSAGRSGSAVITVTVSDGSLSASDSFTVTVTTSGGGPNTAPVISDIPAQTAIAGVPTQPIAFTIFDAETPAENLLVTASANNTNLVPRANIELGGTGTNRTLVITPASDQSGRASVLVAVSDGSLNSSTIFSLTIQAGEPPVNTAPQISSIAAQTLTAGQTSAPIAFTVTDAESAPAQLVVTAAATDPGLLPPSALALAGTGTDRTLTITPPPSAVGETQIELVVSDGFLQATNRFEVSIRLPNQPPTLSALPDQSLVAGVPSDPILFTVADPDTPTDQLVVTAASSNVVLVPPAGLVVGGTGSNRTLRITAAAGQSGTATVTLTVSDGQLTGTRSLQVTVTIQLLPPVILQQPQSVDVILGATATFQVVAAGSPTLQYRWLFNGAPLARATNATLTLVNVQKPQLGNYSVVVSNPADIVFSDSARLGESVPLTLAPPKVLPGGLVELTITGQVGEEYEIYASTDLRSWILAAALKNTSGSVFYIDPESLRLPHRFYQVLVKPSR
jgi:hypothetical protein